MPIFEANAEDEALREWRRKATDLVLVAGVVVHLPILVPFLAGYGPENAGPARGAVALAYAALVAGAAFRRVDRRLRVWLLLVAIYVMAFTGVVVLPQGPYIRAVPLVPPMLAMGLLGVRSARLCTVASAAVLLLAPLLHAEPGVASLLGADPGRAPVSPGDLWLPGAALTADLVVLMILLERFYGFLQQSVAAQRQAASERAAAIRKLEREVEERQRLEGEIARAGDDERRRLGHEVHDGVCQQLTGALLRCQALELRLEKGALLPAAELDALSTLLGETIHEARAVAQGLCPLEPVPEALVRALGTLVRRTQETAGVACEFRASGDPLVTDPETAQHLYRIAQEALHNAVRHARAGLITVQLSDEGGSLLLRVEDDGVGLSGPAPEKGMGLRTMSFRAQILEGEIAVEPADGGGTRVTCRVPHGQRPRAGRPPRERVEGSAA